jgi:predicted nucleic acid-binding protein
LAKKSDIIKYYQKEININISELIKLAKVDEGKGYKLDVFYNAAVNSFSAFLNSMRVELEINVDILDSLADLHYDMAIANMRIMQLDIIDSFHLVIAQENDYDFLATLDNDFVHNFYQKGPSLSTRIIKVA